MDSFLITYEVEKMCENYNPLLFIQYVGLYSTLILGSCYRLQNNKVHT